jgi:hypothetical protein
VCFSPSERKQPFGELLGTFPRKAELGPTKL